MFDINTLLENIKYNFQGRPVDASWVDSVYDCITIADDGVLSQTNIDYIIASMATIGSNKSSPVVWTKGVEEISLKSHIYRLSQIINVLLPEESILDLATAWPRLATFMEQNIDHFDSEILKMVITICK